MKSYSNASSRWGTVFDLVKKEQRLKEVQGLLEDPEVWKDQEKGKVLSKELTDLKKEVEEVTSIQKKMQDVKELVELGSEEKELQKHIDSVEQDLTKAESQAFLSGKYDKGNAILTITAGAGGQDAQDWATMLHRMYLRYADKQGWKTTEVAHSFGEAGAEGRTGTKQVTFEVQGNNAYGLLKREVGVHRLVRLSPFSAKQLRHTSFASLEVLPILNLAEEKDIVISPDDIRHDTFRASGPGGQYVNKRETAIRITHIPTNIVVASQAQRSLQQNKDKALEMLAAKLYDKKKKEEAKERASLQGEKKSIEWGSQIRSYVLQPYQLVKDHRTNTEVKNVQAVLDGDLDLFIEKQMEAQQA